MTEAAQSNLYEAIDLTDYFLEEEIESRTDRAQASVVKKRKEMRLKLMRTSREENLKNLWLPLENGYSYHYLTAGDIDFMSFLSLIIEKHGPLEDCYASTWTMSREDCELLDTWLAGGQIRAYTMFVGEYLHSRKTDIYYTLTRLMRKHGCRLKMFANHCKIIAAHAGDFYAVVEGSANFTTNPRTENQTITVDRELYEFYRAFFEDILCRRIKAETLA